jgi:hypothetical protein
MNLSHYATSEPLSTDTVFDVMTNKNLFALGPGSCHDIQRMSSLRGYLLANLVPLVLILLILLMDEFPQQENLI